MVKVELLVILGCALVVGGMVLKSRLEDHEKLAVTRTALSTEQNTAAGYDIAVQEKLRNDARIDAAVGKSRAKSRELETNDPTYREYLDRPLPDGAVQLYRNAAAEFRAAERARTAGADAGRQ